MNLPISNPVFSNITEHSNENEFGETPLPFAPQLFSSHAKSKVTPQQYLDVNRSLKSVETILSKITTPEKFVLFAGEENGMVYLLCAIVGYENYQSHSSYLQQKMKVVYGRRWLLEPTTPTSEVIQTALLAVKKVREHELRECFSIRNDQTHLAYEKATPFNCHMDLPLMANERTSFDKTSSAQWQPETLLSNITVDNLRPTLNAQIPLSQGRTIYDITLKATQNKTTAFADLKGKTISVICENESKSHFLHQLFNSLLQESDRFIDEKFKFDDFARFSQTICPTDIAEFSYRSRNIDNKDSRFKKHFKDMSYRVDASKAPKINKGVLGASQRETLNTLELKFGKLEGYLPLNY